MSDDNAPTHGPSNHGEPGLDGRMSLDYFRGTAKSVGLVVKFKDVSYIVHAGKKNELRILNNVTGMLMPGKMTALMGPSGSGKSTLLDVLAGRKTAGQAEGTIEFGGEEPTLSFLKRWTGYVEQFDTLLDALTVEEMLTYMAHLKRSHRESAASKSAAVEAMIAYLNLGSCRTTMIGNPLRRGISGGQAKRVNIGIALITEPRVLFLDEPTSGLDSYTADEVMSVVKDLTRSGVTVCSTIHSPSTYTFELFDDIILLYAGNVIYRGQTGAEMTAYFNGLRMKMPDRHAHETEAEWMVRATTAHRSKGGAEAVNFAQHWADSTERRKLEDAMDSRVLSEAHTTMRDVIAKDSRRGKATAVPWYYAMLTMFRFRGLNNFKNSEYMGARIGDKLLASLVVMSIFWMQGDDTDGPQKIINTGSILFMAAVLPSFGAAAYIPSIVMERALFYRERADGCYFTGTYVIYKMLEEFVVAAPLTLVLSLITFYPLALLGNFAAYWLLYLFTLTTGISFAYVVGSISSSMEVANALLPAVVVVQLFVAGMIVLRPQIPVYYIWFHHIDWLTYSFLGFIQNQFSGVDNAVFTSPDGNLTPVQFYDVDGSFPPNEWGCVGVLIGFTVVFTALATLTLSKVNMVQR